MKKRMKKKTLSFCLVAAEVVAAAAVAQAVAPLLPPPRWRLQLPTKPWSGSR
jgi:hypothetical protein